MSRECTFLYKENNTDDRDCVKYIDLDCVEANHVCIDGKFNVTGPCFSMSLKEENIDFDNITTVLTKEELKQLCNPEGQDFRIIIAKLESSENLKLFEEVQKEEIEWMQEEYGFSDDDIEILFDEYFFDYKDRGIIGYIYNGLYELGYERVECLGLTDDFKFLENYIDFEKLAEDLINDGFENTFMEIEDGRIVQLNY